MGLSGTTAPNQQPQIYGMRMGIEFGQLVVSSLERFRLGSQGRTEIGKALLEHFVADFPLGESIP